MRCWKTRTLLCHGADTGSDFARPEREQTSNGCPVVRTHDEPFLGRKANGGAMALVRLPHVSG
ncbi:MAG: hypothetical protein ACFFCW_33745 [Candidatus Hodarchaeota archaeon]